ncbi:MAG: ectonucleotide pyrophosphatase/phosphodiesterase [Bacteroidota bacterium]|nr:ectonucleotide pyrophosphatase/phosphodiesterase [Bacteroidota bacterium]
MKTKLFILLSILTISFSCKNERNTDNKTNSNTPYLVMLSLDGFRWDYPEKANTPNFDYIEEIGVRADAIIPCFPTKTFPNHYSMATGLYPDNHGIILNSFYAPDIDKNYAIRNKKAVLNPDFYFGEPIWVTAEKQGIKSASYFWVGSETNHEGILPSYHYAYKGSVPFEERLDGVIKWLKLPKNERPHLVLWYIQEPDSKGHEVGPNHPELISMVEYLDSIVGAFNKKIANLAIADKVNIIITSDHGMGEISKDRTVYLFDLFDKKWCEHIDGGNPAYSIDVKDEYYDTVYNALSSNENITVWKKENAPERLHYGSSIRVKDFIVVADSSWSLLKSSNQKAYSGGTHGYDNKNTDMHAIFYAYGPAFKNNYKHHSINNIDIYPLICNILNLKPAKIDGDLQNAKGMLLNKE